MGMAPVEEMVSQVEARGVGAMAPELSPRGSGVSPTEGRIREAIISIEVSTNGLQVWVHMDDDDEPTITMLKNMGFRFSGLIWRFSSWIRDVKDMNEALEVTEQLCQILPVRKVRFPTPPIYATKVDPQNYIDVAIYGGATRCGGICIIRYVKFEEPEYIRFIEDDFNNEDEEGEVRIEQWCCW